jgi:hypothetical protein
MGGAGVWSCLLTSAPSSRRASAREGSRSRAGGRPGRKIRLGEDWRELRGRLYPAIRRREDERTRGSADASTAGLPARRRTLLDLPGRLSMATLALEAIKGAGADWDQATADAKEGTRWQRSR